MGRLGLNSRLLEKRRNNALGVNTAMSGCISLEEDVTTGTLWKKKKALWKHGVSTHRCGVPTPMLCGFLWKKKKMMSQTLRILWKKKKKMILWEKSLELSTSLLQIATKVLL